MNAARAEEVKGWELEELAFLTLTVVPPTEQREGGSPGAQAWGWDLEDHIQQSLGPISRPPSTLSVPSSANI